MFNSRKSNNLIKKWAKDLNRHFSQRRHTDDHRYMKICSTPLVIRKMQIKTEMIYHLKVRTVSMKKTSDNKCW